MGVLTRFACFLLVIKSVCSLQFYLKEGQTLCFGENIAPNTKVLAEYTVAAGSGHMPVDILVKDLAENKTLYEKNDINHGKFAFIAPFGKELPHIHSADLSRKDHHDHEHGEHHDHDAHEHHHRHHEDSPPEHDHGHDWDHDRNHHDDHHDGGVHHRQTRGLLSFDEHSHDHGHDHGHGYRAPPEAHNPHSEHDFGRHSEHHHDDHEHDHEHGHDHEKEYNHKHNDEHESHYNDHGSRDYHQHHDDHDHEKKLDHMDAHDGEHGNMEEDWDLDKYDGIHDEDLEKDWDENEKKHPGHDDDFDEDDFTQDSALFKERKFEICLISRSNNNVLSRRVRLHLRHGKAAHDYTRLAKTEHLSSLELTLRIVSDELKELHTELDHARQLEDSLRILNENTSRRVVHYATFSMFVLLGVSAFQAMYTKRFFKTKKLL